MLTVKTPLNILALAPNPWNGQWVNRQQLLSRLGAARPILYSNGAWMLHERHSPGWQAASWRGGFVAQDNISLDKPAKLLTRWPRLPAYDRTALNRITARWRREFQRRGTGHLPLVAYLCHPLFEPYLDALRPDHVVYHCYDLLQLQPSWTPQLEAAEQRLLREADLVFAPTALLGSRLKELEPSCHPRELANAADVQSVFRAQPDGNPALAEPPDLAVIPHPRIGYVGSIHPQLDLSLLVTLAEKQPTWQFVLIGPEQNQSALHAMPAYQRCRELTNVHLLGERHRTEVPAYITRMDVNTMIYRAQADSWTQVAYPLKLHEYMATGKPLVSVPLEAVDHFRPLIRFASGPDEWAGVISELLAGEPADHPQRRRAVAAENSWDRRVAVLNEWLDELPALKRARLARQS